jgi:hypothetical protein
MMKYPALCLIPPVTCVGQSEIMDFPREIPSDGYDWGKILVLQNIANRI